MSVVKLIFWPFAALYNLAMRLRNHLYDIGQKPSFSFESVVISVGNLTVGGTGKTPMIEYLVRLLKGKYKLAILSRGYGRHTKGFRLAIAADDATSIGDEPYQYFLKFGEEVLVAVCEERALAIPTLLNEPQPPQVILLDDAFQHRSVVPQLSILLTEYRRPFFNDYLMPFGRLREARGGAARADAIVVTKCEGSVESRMEMDHKIKTYAGDKPVFFSGLNYRPAVPFHHPNELGKKVILVTGIANTAALAAHVTTHFELLKHLRYADHHQYTIFDIERIEAAARQLQADVILTTEKDWVKLKSAELMAAMSSKKWFYLPIETEFINCGAEFDAMVKLLVESRLHELELSTEG
ncbi:MAG: tetraacyldisaccharide 4'-kinase [Cytophagales bacterium]